ncbi:MAG: FliM/FliN family flagellar motor switch protein [Rubrivivax sp.]
MSEPLPIDPLDTLDLDADEPAPEAPAPRRKLAQLMRKIPVTLTLEVGSARISLDELSRIRADSVVPLDTLAGEALTIKVNGTTIGRAEVVVTGDKYGLKVVEVSDLDLGLPEA